MLSKQKTNEKETKRVIRLKNGKFSYAKKHGLGERQRFILRRNFHLREKRRYPFKSTCFLEGCMNQNRMVQKKLGVLTQEWQIQDN